MFFPFFNAGTRRSPFFICVFAIAALLIRPAILRAQDESAKSEIRSVLNAWNNALNQRAALNLEPYIGDSVAFYKGGNISKSEYLRRKQNALSKLSSFEQNLEFSSDSIDLVPPDLAIVLVRKRYEYISLKGTHTNGDVVALITMKKNIDKWQLIGEQEAKVIYQDRTPVQARIPETPSVSGGSSSESSEQSGYCSHHPWVCAAIGAATLYALYKASPASKASNSSSVSATSSSSGEAGMIGRCVRPKSWLQKDHWVGKVVDEGGNYYRVRLLAVGKNTSYRQGETFEVLKDEVELTGVHDGMNSVQDIWDSATKGCR